MPLNHLSASSFQSEEESGESIDPKKSLTVIDNRTGSSYTIPIIHGHYIEASQFKKIAAIEEGEDRGTTGLKVYDPSFMNTAATKSSISFVDGENSVLLYRGYRIEDLFVNSNYLEVSYLLIYGDLPTKVSELPRIKCK